jgi:integrase
MSGTTGVMGLVIMSRSDWVCHDDMAVVLRLLMPANALVMELCLCSGLRVGDALALRTAQLRRGQRITITERKTGKRKRIYVSKNLHSRLLAQAGVVFVFPGAKRPEEQHRTRQAVWADVKRAAKALRLDAQCSPHSTRKIYAVDYYRKHGLAATQAALNHDRAETTLLYIMSELLNRPP